MFAFEGLSQTMSNQVIVVIGDGENVKSSADTTEVGARIFESVAKLKELYDANPDVFEKLDWDWEVHYEDMARKGHYDRLYINLQLLINKANLAVALKGLRITFENWNHMTVKDLKDYYSEALKREFH